jgi:hypothetical protein
MQGGAGDSPQVFCGWQNYDGPRRILHLEHIVVRAGGKDVLQRTGPET